MSRLRNRHFLIGDLLLLPVAVLAAYFLRLDGVQVSRQVYWQGFLAFTLLVTLLTPCIFWRFGVYSRYWRYASVEEIQLLVLTVSAATLLASGLTWLILTLIPGYHVFPRSIPFIFELLAVPATALPRIGVRLLAGYTRRVIRTARPRVLVMGAGDAGVMVARELRRPQSGHEAVGFLDDDPQKRGVRILGLPVLGDRRDLARIVEQLGIDRVIIAIPSAPGPVIREIADLCEAAGVGVKIVPGLGELLDGTINLGQLRDIQVEDLLRRAPVQIDTAAVGELVRGKRVLVTGAGGSIGSELCRQIVRHAPAELILLGHGENSIFEIHQELRDLASNPLAGGKAGDARPAITPIIADVRFADRLKALFLDHRPDIVFHAAAHKHVPLMEANPAEAITNNVLGTRNVLDAALAADTPRLVLISTDKAVNPTTIMGASKRVAELLVHRAARQTWRAFVAVRFGNVLGSRGSVLPTFKRQVAAGGPLTVTHPDMTRYFMTIPEAVQLVLQAAVLGRGGEVFVLDMGEPVKIVDLARDVIELSGLEPGRDIQIAFTGLRPGEKLYEELFDPDENYGRTRHAKIFTANNADRFVPLHLDDAVARLRAAAHAHDRAAIVAELLDLVPGFQPRTTDEPPAAEQHQAD
ncbi:MAG: nucleoside-diphosphate sugar epimerase/dehydratase [Thermomicrobiales bacterium]